MQHAAYKQSRRRKCYSRLTARSLVQVGVFQLGEAEDPFLVGPLIDSSCMEAVGGITDCWIKVSYRPHDTLCAGERGAGVL